MKRPPSTQYSVVDDAHILIQEITEYNPFLGGLRLNAYRGRKIPDYNNPLVSPKSSVRLFSPHAAGENIVRGRYPPYLYIGYGRYGREKDAGGRVRNPTLQLCV
jgi:hypothetical protein